MIFKNVLGGFFLLLLSIAVVGSIVVLTGLQQRQRLASEGFCSDAALEEHVVLLIDRTDPFTTAQQKRLATEVDQAVGSLDVEGKLSIFLINPLGTEPASPFFSQCRPKRGEDVSWLNANPILVQEAYAETFELPVREKVAELQTPSEAVSSPIMEAIRDISVLPDFQHAVDRRQLIVFSDLLQNMPQAYTQYSTSAANLDYGRFIETRYAGTVTAQLRGVAVKVMYRRNGKAAAYQLPTHEEFWREWFHGAGADSVQVEHDHDQF